MEIYSDEDDGISDDVDNNTKKGEKTVPKKEKISLKEIDDRLMTIDDFLN